MAAADPAVAHRLLGWLEERADAMSALLRALVEAESPSSEPASQAAVRQALIRELERLEFRVRTLRRERVGNHLLARPRERSRGAPFQLIVGHLDTVWPLGTLEQRPAVADPDVIRGPGTYDMKGGLVQGLFALAALRALALPVPATPVIFVNSDEEIGSLDSQRYLRMLARRAERAFVLEASFGPGGALKTGRKGIARFQIMIHGKAAHAGNDPESGVSAILELSHQVQRLFELNDPARGITVNVGTIDGGLRSNVIAPTASALVEARVPSEAAAEDVERAIRSLEPTREGIRIEVDGGFGRPPMEETPRNLALWKLASEAAGTLGIPLEKASVGGASDGNITSMYTATLDGLGPVGDGAHAPHEYVVAARMPERAALLALLLLAPLREQQGVASGSGVEGR